MAQNAERRMNDAVFQDAYVRVRARHNDEAWASLTPQDITDLIYCEIRAIDLARARRADADFAAVTVW
jgi:hypothetical protein